MNRNLGEKLLCSNCRSQTLKLNIDEEDGQEILRGEMSCRVCGNVFPIEDGIPIFLDKNIFYFENIKEDVKVNLVDHINQKKMQIRFHHNENAEEENIELELRRPYGQTKLYQYLHHYDMNIAAKTFKDGFQDKELLSFGCGRGMDCEFFWRYGAKVAGLDITYSCLKLARERFKLIGGDVETICCDAEMVPLQDNCYDICYAYDSLHHCPKPYKAIKEMLRIAKEAVIIIEPNSSFIIDLSIKLGTTRLWESSGNYKHYFKIKYLNDFLKENGAKSVVNEFSFYKKFHRQPAWFSLLSKFPFFHAIKIALFMTRKSLGSLSNHCIVIGYK